MIQGDRKSKFQTKLLRPLQPGGESSWTFVVLPWEASEKLPRRGRTTVDGKINGHRFEATLEPDGQRSHWLKMSKELQDAVGAPEASVILPPTIKEGVR